MHVIASLAPHKHVLAVPLRRPPDDMVFFFGRASGARYLNFSRGIFGSHGEGGDGPVLNSSSSDY